MNTRRSKVPLMISAGLLLLVLSIALGVLLAALKVRQNRVKSLPVYGQINDFALTNQLGNFVSLADLKGRPWVADIIFTRCAGPCPRLTRQMKELQDVLPATDSVRFVSLTTDPEFDTPPILKVYAEKFGADASRWFFLSGTKRQISDLASEGLKLSAMEKKPDERENAEDISGELLKTENLQTTTA